MNPYIQILIGSFLLSLAHALIPSHWLPIATIGKAEKWSRNETLKITAVTGFSHTLSTVIIGIIVGIVGYKLSESYHVITHLFAPAVLILLGLIYLALEYRHKFIKHPHKHHHIDVDNIIEKKKSKKSIVITLMIAMFFSPCLEIEVYYLTAGRLGWTGIAIVSVVYFFVTVFFMMLLVYLVGKGMSKLKWEFLEHHDKLITGLILIVVGLLAYFIEY
ncbi:hypothetical protein ACSSWA_07385 [Melioribacter sp. Ez-97]|uniref:hypothetical protein n=1 Tax=Melioribacter sp. Ez-97 TaxID=3423434 RepID=UPI003EDAF8C8